MSRTVFHLLGTFECDTEKHQYVNYLNEGGREGNKASEQEATRAKGKDKKVKSLNLTSVVPSVTRLVLGTLRSPTATSTKTSSQNTSLLHYKSFMIIPSCSRHILLAKYPENELVREWKILSCMVTLSSKPQIWWFHVGVMHRISKIFAKIRAARAARLFMIS